MRVRAIGDKGRLGLLVPMKVSRKLRQNSITHSSLLSTKWTITSNFMVLDAWLEALQHWHPHAFPQTMFSTWSTLFLTLQFGFLQGVAKCQLPYEAVIWWKTTDSGVTADLDLNIRFVPNCGSIFWGLNFFLPLQKESSGTVVILQGICEGLEI